jgi:hypothetical protein
MKTKQNEIKVFDDSNINGIKEYDDYVKNKKLFRQRIRNCSSMDELYGFLIEIVKSNTITVNSNFAYKVSCKNKYNIPFEDIAIVGDSIIGYFYMQGSRIYKSIEKFSYNVFLIKSNYSESFSVTKQ